MTRLPTALFHLLPGRVQRAVRRSQLVTTLLVRGSYEPELRAALKGLVRPGSICVDVGAHHGVITRELARLVGTEGTVVAFEAHPDNFELLCGRLRSLGARVRAENLAVTNGEESRVWLHPGRVRASAEWNIGGRDLEGTPTQPELEVGATSLDAYFAARGERPDLVKIDVEGAEAEVLAGMRRLLRDARPALVIEFHDAHGWEGRQALLEASYDLFSIGGDRIDPDRQRDRLYHCVALPREQPARASFADVA